MTDKEVSAHPSGVRGLFRLFLHHSGHLYPEMAYGVLGFSNLIRRQNSNGRYRRVRFGVNNVKALAEELIAKGVELARPIESFTISRGEIRSIYVRDPDGILVQFNTPGSGG